ncbi:MAG: hypothetical protein J3K34DRAFT_443279 [Monoraphidium minutum]|nr:MAG: hypothetical protein J3K34DRAFT_443279 [Monoraphidium minutum]
MPLAAKRCAIWRSSPCRACLALAPPKPPRSALKHSAFAPSRSRHATMNSSPCISRARITTSCAASTTSRSIERTLSQRTRRPREQQMVRRAPASSAASSAPPSRASRAGPPPLPRAGRLRLAGRAEPAARPAAGAPVAAPRSRAPSLAPPPARALRGTSPPALPSLLLPEPPSPALSLLLLLLRRRARLRPTGRAGLAVGRPSASIGSDAAPPRAPCRRPRLWPPPRRPAGGPAEGSSPALTASYSAAPPPPHGVITS